MPHLCLWYSQADPHCAANTPTYLYTYPFVYTRFPQKGLNTARKVISGTRRTVMVPKTSGTGSGTSLAIREIFHKCC